MTTIRTITAVMVVRAVRPMVVEVMVAVRWLVVGVVTVVVRWRQVAEVLVRRLVVVV